ncbi:MAG: 2-oxoadipate dioxygenase/decarboxylase family protein [Gammaproteobacteria bacterium]
MSYQNLFMTLWNDYTERNPHVYQIHQLFKDQDEHVINDHIALRTFSDPRVNVDVLAKPFLEYGYKESGTYDFPVKKLFAKHYEHADPEAPKVFISELITEKFSPKLQEVIKQCVDRIPEGLLGSEQLLYSGSSWRPLSYETYQALLAESEYAAWMYAFGFCANHFTVNVNALNRFKEVNQVNDFLISHGFKLNASGGLIKGTREECLEQSSTLAGEIDVRFIEGTFSIPSCYYEFAKRYPLSDGKLYTGFIAASADKIFESTDVGMR